MRGRRRCGVTVTPGQVADSSMWSKFRPSGFSPLEQFLLERILDWDQIQVDLNR